MVLNIKIIVSQVLLKIYFPLRVDNGSYDIRTKIENKMVISKINML